MHILIIFGTRPEAIKMAPLVKLLSLHPAYKITVCVTAQHRHLLDDVLNLFEITPDFDLNIMQSHQTLTQMTCMMLPLISEVIEKVAPDMVMVHGDVTTGFVGALSSFYHKIPVAHIEAGLRTYNHYNPFPEEMNRSLISRLATYHFAPTAEAVQNLRKEHIPEKNIILTGNTVIDALLWMKQKLQQDEILQKHIAGDFSFLNPDKKLILVTGHRRENWDFGLANMCMNLKNSVTQQDCQIIYAVHPNPKIQKIVREHLGDVDNVFLVPPLSYGHFVYLMQKSYVIVTDSGGIQEEAPALGVPILLTRNQTERPEGVQSGYVTLVGNEGDLLTEKLHEFLQSPDKRHRLPASLYGDGTACQKIVDFLDGLFSR